MTPKRKKPKTKKHYKQKPVPGTNRLIDLVTPALPPGWRISERTGKPYFENRENRSDTAEEIAAFVPKPKKPKTANPKKKTTAKQTTAKAKKPAAPKKTTAPMAVIYGPYLTGSTGYTPKKGTGQWEGYWCIRQGWRKDNKSPFVWSSSEAVTMGHIPMDRGETAALQYLAEVAKRKGWKQMYPKKPAAPKKKPTAEPKTASPEKKPAKRTDDPISNKINPYQKPGDFVCDGKIKAAWKNRYAAFKRGIGNMPLRLKCESTGDIYMGDSPDFCRLRLNHKDDHCIWFRGYNRRHYRG